MVLADVWSWSINRKMVLAAVWSWSIKSICRYVFCVILCIAVSVYLALSYIDVVWFEKADNNGLPVSCPRPEAELLDLARLVGDFAFVADRLNIRYFLAYGSLFGALRYGGPIPWDVDADVGVVTETVDVYTLAKLRAEFAKENITILFDLPKGTYHFFSNRHGGAGMDVFRFVDKYGLGWMQREVTEGGWLRALKYQIHHSFPARLIKPPLPLRQFGERMLKVPREGYEIQKYHYRHGWEKEILPVPCQRLGLKELHNMTARIYRLKDHSQRPTVQVI